MNLENMLGIEQLKKRQDEFKRVFFFRICGTGMGACASLLKESGIIVEGGDIAFYPPMSNYLKDQQIPLHDLNGVDEVFLKQYDLVVVGNAIPRESDHAKLIERSQVPFCSFPAILGALLLGDVNVIGIAGTHGKTTTTYLLSQLFENLGEKPGYFIGGVINNTPPAKLGDGHYFFIESDEYDSAYFEKISKFRSYQINSLILTSLEFDHADIFTTIDDIKEEFYHLVPQVDGVALFNADYPASIDLHQRFQGKDARIIRCYQYGEQSKVGPFEIRSDKNGSTFSLLIDNKMEEFTTNLIGKHNILNLTSAILFATSESFPLSEIRRAINHLKLVKRRQELRGKFRNSPVIDDFAHHPTAAHLTISAMRAAYPKHQIITLLEPGSATARSNLFQDRWVSALKGSSHVILIHPQKRTTIKDGKDLDFLQLQEDLIRLDIQTEIVSELAVLQKRVEMKAGDQHLLLFLSNGPCLGLWDSTFIDELQ
jgi:UDP-N-acetylmuramate: L-alanyl-gamma-D-glutamyl-meso-diaminopimelate ligase